MNILGIDFEDWYHPELVQKYILNDTKTPKIVNGIHKILDLLRKTETNVTFFVVGELLEHKPELLDLILENDHEIAFHTMKHTRLDSLNSKEQFDMELKKFKKLTNDKSNGFRAPSFSLNENSSWAIDILENNNYVYDSSIVPAKTSLYGMPHADTKPYKITSECLKNNSENGKILEFPLLVTKFLGKTLPAAGGFYLRTLPSRIIENAIKSYQKKNIPGVFYIHSWELTPEFMPSIKLPKKEHFVTFHNINKAYAKMDNLLQKFEFTSFKNYLNNE